jgi:hypothetical protein
MEACTGIGAEEGAAGVAKNEVIGVWNMAGDWNMEGVPTGGAGLLETPKKLSSSAPPGRGAATTLKESARLKAPPEESKGLAGGFLADILLLLSLTEWNSKFCLRIINLRKDDEVL